MVLILSASMLLSTQALAWHRDLPDDSGAEVEGSAPAPEPAPHEVRYREPGQGVVTAGYVFLGVGGLAAIAGSTIIAMGNHNTMGVVVGGSGAAVSLAGTLMILLGGQGGYALAPVIDPGRKSYGMTLAANF
jgi:hypothetical protein